MKRFTFIYLAPLVFGVISCSDKISGPIQVKIVQSAASLNSNASRCVYTIAPATLTTLNDLSNMSGQIGSVVLNDEELLSRPEILRNGEGFYPLQTQFIKQGNVYTPLDFASLNAATIYYHFERAFLQFEPSLNLSARIPNFSSTYYVYEARRKFKDQGELTDNAEYYPREATSGSSLSILNYFFINPIEEVTHISFGLNLGIMVHEFSHLVIYHLFELELAKHNSEILDVASYNTLRAFDEGLADYFGFLAVKDPAYFTCTLSDLTERILTTGRFFDSNDLAKLKAGEEIDAHSLGSVYASLQYEIGELASAQGLGGHEENGKVLLNMVSNLASCLSQNFSQKNPTVTLEKIVACQQQSAGSLSSITTSVFQRGLGGGVGF